MADALKIETRTGFGLAAVMARKGVTAEAVAAALQVPTVNGPQWTAAGDLSLIGTGPGTWLAMAETAPETHADRMQAALGELASVVDQSGGYVVLWISGARARTLLQRGVPIDLHPQAFGPGSVAVTVIAHMGVILRQLDAAPTYEVALFRSHAESFRRWLDHAAAAL